MNDLAVIDRVETMADIEVTESRDIARMIGKQHCELMAMLEGQIRKNSTAKHIGIIPILSENGLCVEDYFIKSTYKVKGNNKSYKCYLITKKGADFIGNKMKGKQGTLFTARYVARFNDMEQSLRQGAKAKEQLMLGLFSDDPIVLATAQNELRKLVSEQKMLK